MIVLLYKKFFYNFIHVTKCSSFYVAFKALVWPLICCMDMKNRKIYEQNVKLNYLSSFYRESINKINIPISCVHDINNGPIWFCWLQGKDFMPPIVRCCYEQACKNAPVNHDVVFIDLYNYNKYVKIPQYIIDKVHNKIISLTHFSDILRMALVYEYGGLWMDSTIYIPNSINECVFNKSFFSLSCPNSPFYVSRCKWSSFLFAAPAKSVLVGFVLDVFYKHWSRYNCFIDYYSIDYVIAMAYNNNAYIRYIIDDNTLYSEHLYDLQKLLGCEFKKNIYESIINSTSFSKLSWKKNASEKDEKGNVTYYGYILNASTKK